MRTLVLGCAALLLAWLLREPGADAAPMPPPVLPVAAAAAPRDVAFADSFEAGTPGDWEPYGEGCRLEMAPGPHGPALRAHFDDSSKVAWANKGMRIRLGRPVSWGSFRYLVHRYHLDRPASSLGYLLHDRAGNWWRASVPAPRVNAWHVAAVTAAGLKWAWNDDPNILAGERDSEIVELFLSAGTEKTNTGARYALTVDDVGLVRALPAYAGEVEEPAAETPALLPVDEMGSFDLQWKVAGMDRRGYLLVDGQPFFPLGLYSCIGIDAASGAHPQSHPTGPVDDAKVRSWMESIRDAGFNLVQTYTMQFYGAEMASDGRVLRQTTPEKQREGWFRFMDAAHRHRLKVMAGCAPPYCAVALPADPAERAKVLDAWKERTRANIAAWKDHPALLLWYLLDEPSSINMPVRDLVEQYRYLKALDTQHPFLVASCAATDTQYLRGLDIIAPDPYPIESEVPMREIAARLRPLRQLRAGAPPMPQAWAVIQIAQWVEGKRLPTAEEIRMMALLAMTQEVTGLLFYEFRNYADTNPKHWAQVGRAVKSLQSAIPDLLAPGRVVRDLRVSDRRLYALAKEVAAPGAGLTILTANPSQNIAREPMGLGEVTLTVPGAGSTGAAVTALDEDGQGRFQPGGRRQVPCAVSGKDLVITDEFGPLAAHVYRVALPAPARRK